MSVLRLRTLRLLGSSAETHPLRITYMQPAVG